jgi:hypothetical protein
VSDWSSRGLWVTVIDGLHPIDNVHILSKRLQGSSLARWWV